MNTEAKSDETNAFSKEQKSILLLCFLCYSAAYMGRLNISAALPGITSALAISDVQSGMFQTVFAIVYAVGQIVNGSLSDRIKSKINIGLGLIISSVCNIAFAMSMSYSLSVVIWALNGVGQSMIWTPVVKLISEYFSGEKRDRASFIMSITVILGHFAAWGISGLTAAYLGIKTSFIIPAFIMTAAAVYSIIVLCFKKKNKTQTLISDSKTEVSAQPVKPMTVGKTLSSTGLIALLICCICNGFVRDSIVTWTPTVLASGSSSVTLQSTLLSLILPIFELVGIAAAKKSYAVSGSSARKANGIVLASSAVFSFILIFVYKNTFAAALMLALACAANYGVNPMLTTFIPMEYDKAGRVGFVAGTVDCFIYIGSALAGVLTGAVSESSGWQNVYVLWTVVALAGAGLSFVSASRGKKGLSEL